MTNEEIERHLFFAKHLINIIDNVEVPMLMYEEEKKVTKEALRLYADDLERMQKGR
jgi:hypothetical protein